MALPTRLRPLPDRDPHKNGYRIILRSKDEGAMRRILHRKSLSSILPPFSVLHVDAFSTGAKRPSTQNMSLTLCGTEVWHSSSTRL